MLLETILIFFGYRHTFNIHVLSCYMYITYITCRWWQVSNIKFNKFNKFNKAEASVFVFSAAIKRHMADNGNVRCVYSLRYHKKKQQHQARAQYVVIFSDCAVESVNTDGLNVLSEIIRKVNKRKCAKSLSNSKA